MYCNLSLSKNRTGDIFLILGNKAFIDILVQRVYPAKLLLFGEYTVLNGSQALAVPLTRWNGKWVQGDKKTLNKTSAYYQYIDWLKNNNLVAPVTAARMINDLEEGWYYQAEIPEGFGVGSSGAYVAAIYDRYIHDDTEATTFSLLGILGQMEGYFHGSSSGMDPMVSFTGQAVYKNEQGLLQSIAVPDWPDEYEVFLINSNVGRTTGPLVEAFKKKLEEPGFQNSIERELIPMVDHAIHFYLSGTGAMLWDCITMISQFQREFFADWIPKDTRKQWDELVNTPGINVKFCGAGGGGYFLVITNSPGTVPFRDQLIRVF